MEINDILSNPTFKHIGTFILLGLTTGVIAKLIIPGRENMGWFFTIVIGLAGSFIGNYLVPHFLEWPQYNPISLPGIGMGIGGAIILVLLNKLVTKS